MSCLMPNERILSLVLIGCNVGILIDSIKITSGKPKKWTRGVSLELMVLGPKQVKSETCWCGDPILRDGFPRKQTASVMCFPTAVEHLTVLMCTSYNNVCSMDVCIPYSFFNFNLIFYWYILFCNNRKICFLSPSINSLLCSLHNHFVDNLPLRQ